MSKLGKLSDETNDMVMELASEMGLENFIIVEPMAVQKSKQLIKISKANPTTEFLTKKPDTVCLYIYEEAFLRLEEAQRKLLLQDAMATIAYDGEKDKIVLGAPSITVTIGGRAKYGDDLINAAETAVWAIQQIAEEEKAKKEAEKIEKAARKAQKKNK